ncbi:MAG: hypothetical protein H6512_06805 [Acidimicrobiia bacterium]|nr:hypothetical protein [Acidimicrobiia bacterium]
MFGRRRIGSKSVSNDARVDRMIDTMTTNAWVAPSWAPRAQAGDPDAGDPDAGKGGAGDSIVGDESRAGVGWVGQSVGQPVRYSTISALGEVEALQIDESGVLAIDGALWSMEWWIRTASGWIRPAGRPGVRQGRVESTPVIETRLSVGSGDDVTCQIGAITGPAPLATMEIRNHSKAPVGVALVVRPFTLTGLGRIDRVGIDGRYITVEGQRVARLPAAPSHVLVGTHGIDAAYLLARDGASEPQKPSSVIEHECAEGLANIAVVFPLNHVEGRTVVVARSTQRPLTDLGDAEVPDISAVLRGWNAQTGQGVGLSSPESMWNESWASMKLIALSTVSAICADLDALAAAQAGLTVMSDPRAGLRGDEFAESAGVYADWWCVIAGLTDMGLGRYCDELFIGLPSLQRKSGGFDAPDVTASTALVAATVARRLVLSPDPALSAALDTNLVEAVHLLERAAKRPLRAPTRAVMAAAARWLCLLWNPQLQTPNRADRELGAPDRDVNALKSEAMAALAETWSHDLEIDTIHSPLARWLALDGGVVNRADAAAAWIHDEAARARSADEWVRVDGARTLWATSVNAVVDAHLGSGRAAGLLDELLSAGRATLTWPTALDAERSHSAGGVGDDATVLGRSRLRDAYSVGAGHRSRNGRDDPGLSDASFGMVGGAPGSASRTDSRGAVSWEVRWHGDRPALLWESAGVSRLELRAPSLDPGWVAPTQSGEALLAQNATAAELLRRTRSQAAPMKPDGLDDETADGANAAQTSSIVPDDPGSGSDSEPMEPPSSFM